MRKSAFLLVVFAALSVPAMAFALQAPTDFKGSVEFNATYTDKSNVK